MSEPMMSEERLAEIRAFRGEGPPLGELAQSVDDLLDEVERLKAALGNKRNDYENAVRDRTKADAEAREAKDRLVDERAYRASVEAKVERLTTMLRDLAENIPLCDPSEEGHRPSVAEARERGHRAWCYTCSTWCYPSDDMPSCPCCQADAIRAALSAEGLTKNTGVSYPKEDDEQDTL